MLPLVDPGNKHLSSFVTKPLEVEFILSCVLSVVSYKCCQGLKVTPCIFEGQSCNNFLNIIKLIITSSWVGVTVSWVCHHVYQVCS